MFRKALIIVPVSITCVLLLCSCSSVQVHENVDLELVNRVERLLSCCPIAEYHKVAQDLWELGPPVIPIVEDFYGCSNSKYPRPLCSMVLLAFKYGFPPNAA